MLLLPARKDLFGSHVQGNSEVATALLLVLSSFAFLAPGYVSHSLQRQWYASVFLMMSVVCAIYHVCDTKLPEHLGLSPCPADVTHLLTLADHGAAYFCILQIGFLVLGLEDPTLQWLGHVKISTVHIPIPPPDVVILSRCLPVVTMTLFLAFQEEWKDFHWQCVILLDSLLLLGFCTFWLHSPRRSSALKVICRLQYWLRLWKFGVLPGLVAAAVFVGLNLLGIRAAHALFHLVLSALACIIIRSLASEPLERRHVEDALDARCLNPFVVRHLLAGPAVCGLPALAASLAMDMKATGEWRWPRVTMSTGERPGGYLVVIGALPTLLALGASFRFIGGAGPSTSTYENIPLDAQLGCLLGYLAVSLGYLTIFAHGFAYESPGQLLVMCFVCFASAMGILTAASLRLASPVFTRTKHLLSVFSCAVISIFVLMLAVDEQLIANSIVLQRSWISFFEYASIVCCVLWPLCWSADVQLRWRLQKGWVATIPSNMS